MEPAKFVAILAGIFLPLMIIVWGMWEERSRAAQNRARRIADAKMNARLLRLNI